MRILVANLGSTSFKYRLFELPDTNGSEAGGPGSSAGGSSLAEDGSVAGAVRGDERQLARGGIDRIGGAESACTVEIGDHKAERTAHVPDHGVAVQFCLEQLADPVSGCLSDPGDVAAIGFKAVHGGRVTGVVRVDNDVLDAMDEVAAVAPAHNPPYIRAMRQLAERFPHLPLVAAFETGFHATIPDRLKYYAIPWDYSEKHLVKRWGFHGASHRYIAGRMRELGGPSVRRVISCHLGGSSSLCAILDGKSVTASMGNSPQTGLPQSNRTGDFDTFAIPHLMNRTGLSQADVLKELSNNGGLLGLSGVSGDMRDLEQAAATGHQRAQLALDVFTSEIRRQMGGMMVELGGLDSLVFTGGIGENGVQTRASVCANLTQFGIKLDDAKNQAGVKERPIHAADSRCQIWVIPTNEEIIVARQTRNFLVGSSSNASTPQGG